MGKLSLTEEKIKQWEELYEKISFDKRINKRIEKHLLSDVIYNVEGCAIIDVDKTITARKALYENIFDNLYSHPEISAKSSEIDESIEIIDKNPGNVKEGFDRLINALKKIPLKEDKLIDACLDAAIDTPPVQNTTNFILDLMDRNIKRALLTYSFEQALVPWYNYKIGITRTHLKGLKLIFRNGILVDYDIGGCYGKAGFAESYIHNFGFDSDDVFAIDDDPILDKVLILMLGIGLVIWTDENQERRAQEAKGLYKYPGKIPFIFPQARNNLQSLTSPIDWWMSLFYYFLLLFLFFYYFFF